MANWKSEEEARSAIKEMVAQYYHQFKERAQPYKEGDRITYAARVYDEKEMCALTDATLDFWLTTGRFSEQFEREFAKWIGVKFAHLVNSGSSANLIAFSVLTAPELGERQIKRGDEVITVACGFPTTVTPVIQYGAVPVFVDVSVRSRPNIINDEILKLDKIKFIYAKEQLENSLLKCENGEFIHEDDFSELIAQFFCLINPKYIKIKTKLNISDFTDARINSQADLCLIDCDGNIDLIEVKSPRAYKNLFRKRPYRSHFVPSGELCGAINQLEQYLKCLTKMTAKDIADKNPDLQRELDGIKLKNVNPKGYIIYGRDYVSFNGINESQKKADFELIKNTYKDLVDIITFDDLIRRFERIINFL